MRHYNTERSRQGYRLNGKTPTAALRVALGVDELPSLPFDMTHDESTNQSEKDTADTVNA